MSLPQPMIDNALFAANIAAVVTSVFTFAALIFLGIQIRGEGRSRNLEGAKRLFDVLDTPEAKGRRKTVYLARMQKRALTEEERKSADAVIAELDQIAMMVREKWLPKKVALKMFSFMTVYSWISLEDYIKKQRELRKTQSWVEDLEWFYSESKKHQEKQNPNQPLHFFNIRDNNAVDHFIEFG